MILSPDDLVAAAIEVAEEGMARGELPIGAVVEMGGLAVDLEPGLMCMGAAMALKVDDVYFGLESPTDGGAAVAASWPSHPWFAPPAVTGGLRRDEVRAQFRRYGDGAPESGFRTWALGLATS